MSKDNIPAERGIKDYESIADYKAARLESSENAIVDFTTNSNERNAKSKSNANISRTNVDTELIDLNADGDSDESKYDDIM
ncbi:hypothetical protein ACN077_11845 [Clostridium chromiireducens]|uniref:hypothetical protein n=1 Tax=Clostridium chromiireducens TaxID=225345 RepID=UPI003AF84CDE